jgi:hypothetical protein
MPTGALVRLSRIPHRRSTVSLTTDAEGWLPTSPLPHINGPRLPWGDVLPADTAVWWGNR